MSYPINAPVNFVNTNGTTDTLNFNADGPTANTINKIDNFVVTTAGDTLYRAAGVNNYLERLPVGTAGQQLTVVGGLPSWATITNNFGSGVFTAFVTASVAGVPTSRDAGLSPGTWFALDNTYVTWSTAAPGNDPDAVFTTASGTFTVPVGGAGTYAFDATVTFDAGAGVNAGAGLPAAPLPSGMAIRQAQIYSPSLLTQLATVTKQVTASNLNSTVVPITVVGVALSDGDTVVVRVRHDRSGTSTVTIGDPAVSLPSQTYLSGRRIR
jgi:hypothetical protein